MWTFHQGGSDNGNLPIPAKSDGMWKISILSLREIEQKSNVCSWWGKLRNVWLNSLGIKIEFIDLLGCPSFISFTSWSRLLKIDGHLEKKERVGEREREREREKWACIDFGSALSGSAWPPPYLSAWGGQKNHCFFHGDRILSCCWLPCWEVCQFHSRTWTICFCW